MGLPFPPSFLPDDECKCLRAANGFCSSHSLCKGCGDRKRGWWKLWQFLLPPADLEQWRLVFKCTNGSACNFNMIIIRGKRKTICGGWKILMEDLIDFIHLRGDTWVSGPRDRLGRHLCSAGINGSLDGECSLPERSLLSYPSLNRKKQSYKLPLSPSRW